MSTRSDFAWGRWIRASVAHHYLGVDRNWFTKHVRPYVPVIRLSTQARAYRKSDLDARAEQIEITLLEPIDGGGGLKKLKLWEVSLTPFPANELARVSAVKSVSECAAIGDWEAILRTHGLSKRKARRCAVNDWPIISGADPEDEDPAPETLKSIASELQSLNKLLKPTF